MDGNPVSLSPLRESHLSALMGWISSPTACHQWGGPWFRYPFTQQSFSEDCRWEALPSFVLENPEGKLLAFGQYYNRLDHCHLGRLIVSSDGRGQGVGKHLIQQLVSHGCKALGVEVTSLFVLKDNQRARALYEKIGYCYSEYSEPMEGLEICDYMVAPAEKIMTPRTPEFET